MPSKLILVCFDFPPNKGIGGRRWAKFSKSLAKRGHEIHVIKAEPKDNVVSQWSKDVDHPLINTYELKRKYPLASSNSNNNTVGKLKYRVTRSKMLRKYRGTIYDDSLGMEKDFIEKLKELIQKENIRNIIVTGAPFNLLYLTAHVKKEFPSINIIGDYRDPWIDAPMYGMDQLNEKRKHQELSKQQFVFENFNHITYPSDALKEDLTRCILNREKAQAAFSTLPHFYDLDEFDATVLHQKGVRKLKWVYGGTLYQGLDPYLLILKNGLDYLKEKHQELYKKFEIKFYSAQKSRLKVFEDHLEVVKVLDPIGKGISKELKTANGILIFLASHNKDFQTTKFMEALPYGKPFVYCGAQGKTFDFINKNSLGYCLTQPNEMIESILQNEAGDPNFNLDFDIQKYSLTSVTEQLESLFVD